MGRIYNNLQNQLNTEYKKKAEDCIKIYNKLKEISGGSVWDSDWRVLVHTSFVGEWPNAKFIYKPSAVGQVFLKGIS